MTTPPARPLLRTTYQGEAIHAHYRGRPRHSAARTAASSSQGVHRFPSNCRITPLRLARPSVAEILRPGAAYALHLSTFPGQCRARARWDGAKLIRWTSVNVKMTVIMTLATARGLRPPPGLPRTKRRHPSRRDVPRRSATLFGLLTSTCAYQFQGGGRRLSQEICALRLQ